MYYNDSNEDVLDEIERRLPDDLDVSRDRGSITADDVIIQPDVGRGYITLTITNTETFEQEVENPRTPLDTVERAISLFENLR